jgi:predicted lipoprotein with Yx(FWY)xxD motif
MTRRLIMPALLASGAALALVASLALAKSYTLTIAHGAKVTDQSHNTKTESIVVNSKGFALYSLTGDSARNPKCTSSQCMQFWPPIKVHANEKLSAEPGIKGKLGTWSHNGFMQLTLDGHPLYMFSLDKHKDAATGEGVVSFGGTWHVHVIGGGSRHHGATTTTTTTGTTTSSYTYSTGTNPTTNTTNSTSSTSTSTTTSTHTNTSTPCTYYC